MAWLIAVADYPTGYYDPHPPLLPGWVAGVLIVVLLAGSLLLEITRRD